MTYAWTGTIAELKSSITSGNFLGEMEARFAGNFFVPTETEKIHGKIQFPNLLKF